MPLVPPNLDDRTWDRLIEEARQRIKRACPTWNDLTPHDPGMVLVEVFAYLTEAMIYRLNRVPDKMYVEFLRLLGVQLEPPAAATAVLRLRRERAAPAPLTVPRGTRVTIKRTSGLSEPPVFATIEDAVLPAGAADATEVEVVAVNAELIEGERLGQGNGEPCQSFTVRRPPIVAPIGGVAHGLIIGVEIDPAEEQPAAEEIVTWNGKPFRRWSEVDYFQDREGDACEYLVDRATGTITFAPAVQLRADGGLGAAAANLAAVPAVGREIRAWYPRGGGPDGNVAAATLTTWKDPVPGVTVVNPAGSAGGRAAESLDNALRRGPLEFRSLQRAVTALDYQLGALSSGAISRAKAFTKLEEWHHATPGTVEVLLVPALPDAFGPGEPVDEALLATCESDDALARTRAELDRRRPLATICEVGWTRYKCVTVAARVVIQSGLDAAATGDRVLRRLHRTICPVRLSDDHPGWSFGQTLHVSHIYEMCLAEPGVRFVENVQLIPEHEPTAKLAAVEADRFQPDTWYVADGNRLFRSQNDGGGWEVVAAFGAAAPEDIARVVAHPLRAGHVAVVTRAGGKFPIHVSADCGQSWRNLWNPDIAVWDVAWTQLRDGTPYLLLATDKGLYEVLAGAGKLIPVDLAAKEMALYAVAVHHDPRGDASVAVAAQAAGGVHLSREEGRGGTFQAIGAAGEDMRTLAFQSRGNRAWLWAGATAIGTDPGTGAVRWELGAKKSDAVSEQTALRKEWSFGGCRGFAFAGNRVLAATQRGGVVWIDERDDEHDPAWQKPPRGCGLPPAPDGRFAPIRDIAALAGDLMVVTDDSVFRARTDELRFLGCARDHEKVTLPRTMLFCSGAHRIEVVAEADARRGGEERSRP